MAALRTLLQYTNALVGGAQYINYDQIVVYNTSVNTAANGGQCCLWTVPTGTTWFAVEMWGGGGAGAGACCCMAGWPGGSGSYTRKIITPVVAGQTYTICAAGSTCCSQVCCSVQGFPSYVKNSGGTTLACASGGSSSCSYCYFQINCSYSGCRQYQCGSFCGTFGICGVTGSAKGSAYCSGSYFQYMPSAPLTGGMNRPAKDGCTGICGGCCSGGYAHFPGGGGASTASHTTGPFCGAAGAGGMVVIYYGVVTS